MFPPGIAFFIELTVLLKQKSDIIKPGTGHQ